MLEQDKIMMEFLEVNYLEMQLYMLEKIGINASYFEAHIIDGKIKFKFRPSKIDLLPIKFMKARELIKNGVNTKWTTL
jgi:hypothetical protein